MVFAREICVALRSERRNLKPTLAVSAFAILAALAPANAQDGGAAPVNGILLEGIVITGEKVERDYLDTFTSVGVATGEDIENYHVDDLNDSFDYMANVRKSGQAGNNTFQIRGMNGDGVAAATNSQPTISVIIDGAVQSVEGIKRGSRGVWDVQQIEVLRGPQSGLYGRSALAGAVVIETNDPTYTAEAAVKGTLGEYDRKDGALMFNAPIVDNQVALRVSAEFHDELKDITFVNPADKELAEDIYRNVRAKLLVEPEAIKGLSALFTVSHTFDKPASQSVTRNVNDPDSDFFDRMFDRAFASSAEIRKANVNNYVGDISYGLAQGYTLRSVTAYIDTDLKIDSASDPATPLRDDFRDGEDFTQDLRLEIKDDIKSGLSGVVGVSYGDFNNDLNTNFFIDAGFGFPVQLQDGVFTNATETRAVYADLRYKVFGNWSLIGGLRYQHDVVRNSADAVLFGNVFPSQLQFDTEATFSVLLPKYGIAYDIDETQSVAVTASRGYRQGFSEADINFDALPPSTITSEVNTIDPEFVWSYEVAYRKTTLDKRLTFGVNLFYNEYTDQQVSVSDPDNGIYENTINAANSISYGAEIEGRYNFGNGLTMFGAVGLLKTEFEDFENATLCAESGGVCSGNAFPEAPNLTFSFGGAYKHESGFFGSASASYTGDYYTRGDVNNLDKFEIEHYFLVNAKVGYEQDGMAISVFADNLLDEEYLTGLSTRGAQPTSATIGDGRTVGVELRAKF